MKKLLLKSLLLTLILSLALPVAGLAQSSGDRPLLYIVSYHTDTGGAVSPWSSFGLTFTLGNNGKAHARNIVLTFSSSEFDALDGGVFTTYEVDAGNASNETHTQHFKVNMMSTWMYSGVITAAASYSDPNGVAYSDTFTFRIDIDQPASSGGSSATPTPVALKKPQIVVSGYETDLDPLQPGSTFALTLEINNVGNAPAGAVSIVYGGGASTSTPTDTNGNPLESGVTGSGADLTNFAPVGKSNVVLLGDMAAGASQSTTQSFVVNVTTQPGAYPLRTSFVYTDPKGNRQVDDQVITLLVYQLPQLEVSFYRDPGVINAGNFTTLPLQITNLAKKPVVLGNVTVTAPSGELSNNTMLIGALDPGGYFTLDASYMPAEAGPLKLNFEIRYSDDFNQLRTYNTSLDLEVQPAIEMPALVPQLDENGNPILDEMGNPIMVDPNQQFNGGEAPQVTEESFWTKIWNAIKSFFGIGATVTPTEVPFENDAKPIAPGSKG